MLLLTGDNTYSGGTYINNGPVGTLGSDTAFGTGTIYLGGGIFGGSGTLSNPIVAEDSTESIVLPVDSLTLTGNISGSGTITCTNVVFVAEDALVNCVWLWRLVF